MQINNKASFLLNKRNWRVFFFYFRIFLVYMQNENAAVVTKCLRIQHVPSNLRNCASYLKLRDGCVSLCSAYIRNAKSALHNAYNA